MYCGQLFQEYGKKLSQTFNELVRNLKESAVSSIAEIMKLLAKIEPSVFFGDFQSNLLFVFDGVIKDENYPPVMTKYFSVLSYLVVYQTESLHQVGQLYCQMNHVSYDEVSHERKIIFSQDVMRFTKENSNFPLFLVKLFLQIYDIFSCLFFLFFSFAVSSKK